ncbi:hypothetical protein MKX03_007667, partial [Papaver bracteatum]
MSIESVCKLLGSTVRSDACLWRYIHIDRPPSRERITNDALLNLANMKSMISQVNIPGCTRLTVKGILKYLKNFKSINILPGEIKQVRVGERYGVQRIEFEVLKSLIGEGIYRQKSNVKNPGYYGHRYSMSCGDNDCAMDIELFLRCL